MQTDDTLSLLDNQFTTLEQDELDKARFAAKSKRILTTANPLQFNKCILSFDNCSTMTLQQKKQGKKIQLISSIMDSQQSYIEQRACGAYITSICQLEAIFDLSVAAQYQELAEFDIATLNK